MPEWLIQLTTQGPLGIISVVFIWLYLNERNRNHELLVKNAQLLEEHRDKLDAVRVAQIGREQEVSATLKEYGEGLVEAVDRAAFIAEEIRRKENGRS